MVNSPTQKCYFHDTQKNVRREIMSGGKRHSRFLPADLDKLYTEAVSNPELIDMSDNIALLEAKFQQLLAHATEEGAVPKWSDVRSVFADIETELLSGNQDKAIAAIERMHTIMDSGAKWDTAWEQTMTIMEQIRKLTDTEVKRKKELNHMIPVERVVVLMAELGRAVKRNVSNPDEIDAVYREFAMIHGSNDVPGRPGVKRIASSVTNLNPAEKGLRGGGSRRAMFRRKAVETRARMELTQPSIIDAETTENN